jgi:tight adherence protein B
VILAVVVGVAVMAGGALARAASGLRRRGTVTARFPAPSSSTTPGGGDAGGAGGGGAIGGGAVVGGGGPLRSWTPPEPPARVGAALADAALPVPAAVAWTAWLGALGGGPLLALVVGGPGLAAVALAVVAAAPVLVVRARRGLAGTRIEQSLPGALEAVARSLRSGASLRQAVEEAGRARAIGPQLAAELSRAAAEASQGGGLVVALEGVAARRPLAGVRLGVAALCLGAETGGAQARAVDGVAATVRERLAVAAELRALSSQARISALVIGLAPIGFSAFAAATDPRTSNFLFHTPVGLGLLTAGLTLDGLGWLWMQRLSQVEV